VTVFRADRMRSGAWQSRLVGVVLGVALFGLNPAGMAAPPTTSQDAAVAADSGDAIPDISADAVRWVQPAGRVFIPDGTSAVWLPVAAEITFPDQLPATPAVGFVLDGALFAASEQFDLYTAAAWLAPGAHELQITVEIPLPQGNTPEKEDLPAEENVWTWTSETVAFEILPAADTDENGLPDAGPGILTVPGDLWLAADTPEGRPRWTALAALRSDDTDTGILLPLPGAVSGLAFLHVPAALALSDLVRVAGLAVGENETALAVAYPEIESERPGTPVPPGVFARISLFEQKGGVWREIGNTLPGGASLRLSLRGLRPSSGYVAFPAVRSVSYYLESPSGQLIPALTEDRWQREPAILAETPLCPASPATLRFTGTGLAGVFQRGIPADLQVEPGGASGYLHLGILPAGKSCSQVFSLTNPGSIPVTGQCLLTGDNSFRLIEPAAYTVLPGQTTTVTVVFLPTAEGNYAANLTFSGSPQGPLTIRLEAHATEVPFKARQLFACGTPRANAQLLCLSKGDAAVVLLALYLLLTRRPTTGNRIW